MICIDCSTGQQQLVIERHRPTCASPRLDVIRSLDSSVVYTTTDIEEGEFYITCPIDTSTFKAGQYQYHIINPATLKVYEQGLIYIFPTK